MYIISSCLLGKNCKYDGGNNKNIKVLEFIKDKNYVEVCPECLGGLSTPRVPSEIVQDKVINKKGEDVTHNYKEGARVALKIAMKKAEELGEEIEGAILKAKSPSCGVGNIYDGTFSKTLIEGDGIFVRELKMQGIKVITENDL